MRSAGVTLTARERQILDAIADALIPPGGHPAVGGAEAGAGRETARLLQQRVPRPVGWLVRLALWIFELLTLLPHLTVFSRLSPALQRRVVREGAASRLPLRPRLLELFRHLLVNPYLAAEEVGERIGYVRERWLTTCEEEGGPLPPQRRLEPITHPQVPRTVECDAVIVGSGAGGAVVAALLAEAGMDVVVVEEGGYHDREELRRDDVWTRFTTLYRDLGLTGTLGRPPIPVPVGRAVGGTTVVNAGTALRAPAAILRRWESHLGIEGVGPTAMAPLFDEVEAVQGVSPPPEDRLGCNAAVFADGLEAATGERGAALPRNQRGCRGCGESIVGCPFDAKQAVHLTWLPRAEQAGARILARVRCDRVVHEGGRVRGIEATVLDPGPQDLPRGQVSITAPTVVVAAGAFHTPVLLSRSEVADPSGWRGRNLQIHPAIGVVAEMDTDVHAWRGVLQSWGSEELMDSHGINVEATAAPPPVTGGQVPFVGRELKELLGATSRLATVGFLIEDSTAGRVWGAPGNRFLAHYQLTDDDARRIAVGFAHVGEALLAAGARRILIGPRDRPWATGRRDLARIREEGLPPSALKLSAYHPVGTHRMAGHPGDGPADPWGGVRGVDGLWVADASLLPSCLGVNPQETIMAVAARTARRIIL